jgi:phytanoyl-CoA hydroxylase
MDKKLSASTVDQFNRDGYLILKGYTPQPFLEQMRALVVDHLLREVEPVEYEYQVGYAGAPSSLIALGGRTIRRLRGAYQRDKLFKVWATAPELTAQLEQLLNEPVRLSLAHHNCVMTKHPQYGTATHWHRDIRYWSFEQPNLVSVWLALGNETASNGALWVIPSSHHEVLQVEQLDELGFLRQDVAANKALLNQATMVELEAGDVLLFHSGIFHSAGKNCTDKVKMSLVFTYHAQSNKPIVGSRSDLG